ncbi:MAG: hypothetical protein H7255_10600 [Ramlibacter sp.]|nr:hypothetical protein [Ramlibacter sp.]
MPTVNGRILAVTVPAEWEEKIVGGEGEPVLRLTSIKSSIEFYGVAEKTGKGTAVTLDGLRPAIFRIAESLKPCTEDDVRPTLFAASEGEGAWIFCTDPAHNAADPDDFKYTYTGVMKIDETYVSFKVLSNEEAADVKSGMHDLLRTIRFYKTPELPNAQGKK